MISFVRSVLWLGLGLTAVACAAEGDASRGYATTSARIVLNDSAVMEVAKARCRRADECNRLGNGQKYVDRTQCIQAFLDEGTNVRVIRSCPNGVDRVPLDKCLATLATQHCDAELGPVIAMPECGSYCASGQE